MVFRLAIRVSPLEIAPGEQLTLEYELTNVSGHAVSACTSGWLYHILGTQRERGEASIANDGPARDQLFTLPPHMSLVWRRTIAAPDVGVGRATVRGSFSSTCESWSGTVSAEPVPVTMRSKQVPLRAGE